MRSYFSLLLAAGLLLPVIASADAPAGWFLAGSDPTAYKVSRDAPVTHDGKKSASLTSIGAPKGFGTLMQTFVPRDYRGKRLRLSAWVKASDVKDWAGIWMRVDGADKKVLSFDNMQNRAIKGTKDWTRYDVVLDVGDGAASVAFGVLLSGEGTLWISGVSMQPVDPTVPTTSPPLESVNQEPTNLDFAR